MVSILFSAVFTIVIWIVGPYLDRFVLGPDTGPEWYYWQLPDPNFTAQVIVWGMYLAHQISVWATIYWAQKNLVELKTRPAKGITKYNWGILVINIFFIFLHLIQTHIWFDGLAQDVPIWTSQGSVIVMLVLILIIENPRRGLFLGKRAGKPMTARVSGLVRRLHMYPIAWAMVYTFWFHPMFYDPQLITGFFYMFVLFTQMAVAYTYIHVDRRWVVFVEGFVGIHAFFVAVYNTALGESADMWPMFLSGFVFLWVFTYMYAFNMKKVYRWIVTIAYFAFLVWIYLPVPFGYGRDLSRIMMLEFLWIPIALYGLAVVFSAIAYLYLRQRKEQ
ncbi:MAG: hypothetical protein EAX95_02205 [Candidatus Thorarchaeota archaeon]|nr:hypothetical protein [Candidatus Thorarchaeota archaeon]